MVGINPRVLSQWSVTNCSKGLLLAVQAPRSLPPWDLEALGSLDRGNQHTPRIIWGVSFLSEMACNGFYSWASFKQRHQQQIKARPCGSWKLEVLHGELCAPTLVIDRAKSASGWQWGLSQMGIGSSFCMLKGKQRRTQLGCCFLDHD